MSTGRGGAIATARAVRHPDAARRTMTRNDDNVCHVRQRGRRFPTWFFRCSWRGPVFGVIRGVKRVFFYI